MKNKYIALSLAFISIIGLSSCINGSVKAKQNIRLGVEQCEYNGHKYNVFYKLTISHALFSVVHDPDCPKCENKKIEIN